ncbi:MAG: hypothetical protein M1281_11275 [Chloroflexi bacterium]|nr:hypothetical protein [Chloroflexota bacterium]
MNTDHDTSSVPESKWKNTTYWMIAGIILGIALILTFLFRGFVRSAIVVPILYLGWLGSLVLNSLGQSLIWIFLIIIVIILAFRVLLRNVKITPPPIQRKQQFLGGRVIYWLRELTMANHVDYLNRDVHSMLANLLFNVLSNQYHITPSEVENLLKKSELDVPASVYRFLQTKDSLDNPSFGSLKNRFMRIVHRFRILQNGRPEPGKELAGSIPQDWVALIEYLEDQMEIDHARSNP